MSISDVPSRLTFRLGVILREAGPVGLAGSGLGRWRRAGLMACFLGVMLGLWLGESRAADNTLTEREKRDGWVLLFDGRTTQGWVNSDGTAPRTPVVDGVLNPHRAGHYMLVHTQRWSDFILSLDFKITNGCNSGVFVRTVSLIPKPNRDVGYNGIEIAIDDTKGAGYHDTGAVYDLVKPLRNAMKPAGEWNRMEIACITNRIEVIVNGDPVTRADLDLFMEPNRRPDGSHHKFDEAFKDHLQDGHIGLQDHGSPCWFKNIKLKPLPRETVPPAR